MKNKNSRARKPPTQPHSEAFQNIIRTQHRALPGGAQMQPRRMSTNRERSIPRHVQRFLDSSTMNLNQRQVVQEVYSDMDSRLADIERQLDEIDFAIDMKKGNTEDDNVTVKQ